MPTGDVHCPQVANCYLAWVFKQVPSLLPACFKRKDNRQYKTPETILRQRFLDDFFGIFWSSERNMTMMLKSWRKWILDNTGHNITMRIASMARGFDSGPKRSESWKIHS